MALIVLLLATEVFPAGLVVMPGKPGRRMGDGGEVPLLGGGVTTDALAVLFPPAEVPFPVEFFFGPTPSKLPRNPRSPPPPAVSFLPAVELLFAVEFPTVGFVVLAVLPFRFLFRARTELLPLFKSRILLLAVMLPFLFRFRTFWTMAGVVAPRATVLLFLLIAPLLRTFKTLGGLVTTTPVVFAAGSLITAAG